MNNTTIVNNTTIREGIKRCQCPKCQGRAGTERVCFNLRKLAARAQEIARAQKVGLLVHLEKGREQ